MRSTCLTMQLLHAFFPLSFFATFSACTAAQEKSTGARPVPAPANVADPLASFARMVGGEWQVTFTSGTSMFDTWHWGPGKHSLRVVTDGQGAGGEPWRELDVVYWHPGRKEVRLLNMHRDVPGIGRGVGEGTIRFDSDTAEAVLDLYQPGVRRMLRSRWTFDGPDQYHEILSESTGPAGFQTLVEWDRVRFDKRSQTRPVTDGESLGPSQHLKVFEPLLARTWEANGKWAAEGALRIQTTVDWVPYADYFYVRVIVPTNDGEPTHLLDAYVYHHIGTGAVRCLALLNWGGVYEGDVTLLEGGALQLDLKGYEGDRIVLHDVRFDFEKDGTVRYRVWSIEGAERTLLLDVLHKKLEPKRD